MHGVDHHAHRYVFSTEGHPFPVMERLQTPVTDDWPLTCAPNTTHPCPMVFNVDARHQRIGRWQDKAMEGMGVGTLRPSGFAARQCPVLGTTQGLCYEADRHTTHTYEIYIIDIFCIDSIGAPHEFGQPIITCLV